MLESVHESSKHQKMWTLLIVVPLKLKLAHVITSALILDFVWVCFEGFEEGIYNLNDESIFALVIYVSFILAHIALLLLIQMRLMNHDINPDIIKMIFVWAIIHTLNIIWDIFSSYCSNIECLWNNTCEQNYASSLFWMGTIWGALMLPLPFFVIRAALKLNAGKSGDFEEGCEMKLNKTDGYAEFGNGVEVDTTDAEVEVEVVAELPKRLSNNGGLYGNPGQGIGQNSEYDDNDDNNFESNYQSKNESNYDSNYESHGNYMSNAAGKHDITDYHGTDTCIIQHDLCEEEIDESGYRIAVDVDVEVEVPEVQVEIEPPKVEIEVKVE